MIFFLAQCCCLWWIYCDLPGSHFMAEKTAEQGSGATLHGTVALLRQPQTQLWVLPDSSSL